MESLTVLITGGTGSVGTALTSLLLERGHMVKFLSRTGGKEGAVIKFKWNIRESYIDTEALDGTDVVVHLAGAGIADKRWTDQRKKEIFESRVYGAGLLFKKITENKFPVKAYISASAIGIYPDKGTEWVDEQTEPDTDFLGKTCVAWEERAEKFAEAGIRTCVFRSGIVLEKEEGALSEMAGPIKLGAGAPLGTGKQFLPWIHIKDISEAYYFAITNSRLSGVFNAVAPALVTNTEFMKTIADVLKKPFFLPAVPEFVIKLMLGERAAVVLKGARVSSRKIESSGFQFSFRNLEDALREIYG